MDVLTWTFIFHIILGFNNFQIELEMNIKYCCWQLGGCIISFYASTTLTINRLVKLVKFFADDLEISICVIGFKGFEVIVRCICLMYHVYTQYLLAYKLKHHLIFVIWNDNLWARRCFNECIRFRGHLITQKNTWFNSLWSSYRTVIAKL